MYLKIMTPVKKVFDGEIEKIIVLTENGELTILPNHTPIATVVKPGIVRIMAKDLHRKLFIEKARFLFSDDELKFTVGRGLLYVDGKNILLNTIHSESKDYDIDTLKNKRKQLKKKISLLKSKGQADKLNDLKDDIDKINMDIKFIKQKAN